MPQNAITSTQPQTVADGQRQLARAGTAPISDWNTSIQKMMATALSVRVSDLVSVTDTAKPTAAASAIAWPALSPAAEGRTIRPTPSSPSTMASAFQRFIRSPRKPTARHAVQIGIVNSSATTCASEISVSATNQPNCAA